MEIILVLLLGLSLLLGAAAVSPCLDLTDANYSCEVDATGELSLNSCAITGEDVDSGDLASCLDVAGRENITKLGLSTNDLTALPENKFQSSTALGTVALGDNRITTLPEGIFQNLTAVTQLYLRANNLIALPQGLFQDLTAVEMLSLSDNNLTTLPEGIFQGLSALEVLHMTGNSLECLPTTSLTELDDDATFWEDGLHVDSYGDECGCSILNVTDNVCGEETCTPGPVGYTCGAQTEAPRFATPTPEHVAEPTAQPRSGSRAPSTAPTPAPSSTPADETSASEYSSIIVGVISAVGFAALCALAVLSKRCRGSNRFNVYPPVLPDPGDIDNLDESREHPAVVPRHISLETYAGHGGNRWPKAHTAPQADGLDRQTVVQLSALPSLDARVQASAGYVENASDAEHRAFGLVGEDGAYFLAEKVEQDDFTPSAPTVNTSTISKAELAKVCLRQRAAHAASVARGFEPEDASEGGSESSKGARQRSASEVRLCHAVMTAAEDLIHHCQISGISEAASVVSIMANLLTNNRDTGRAKESRLGRCRTIVMTLKRAAKVAEKGRDMIGETERALTGDVHEAIFDLVELIKTFENKNKLSTLLMSTLLKRRQYELNAVVDQAVIRLRLDRQLQVGRVTNDFGAVKGTTGSVEDGMKSVGEDTLLYQASMTEASSECVAEARSVRRQRKLDQVKIPEDQVSITDDLLGKGGFGEVYLADYNGHNAAAKVLYIARETGELDDNRKQRGASKRSTLLRELEAMIRLRSPNTVNVYGAVTSDPDRMVLVMELLAGGDLLALLRKSTKPLPEEQCRRIIRDICTGMAFLHSKNTVHGDLKSANVLLDGNGRAKIADFGTSRWSQHANYTDLATYATKCNQSTQMNIAWIAPEVLDSDGSTYKSDVFSFGIVVWEVLSRELPWANKTRPTEILTAVLRGCRPSFREGAPADIVDIAKACWSGKPNERTTFRAILEGMKASGCSNE